MKRGVKGKRILVVGLGRTGISVARFLKRKGAEVMASDINQPSKFADSIRELEALGISIETGGHTISNFLESDLIVVSPGVPLIEPLQEAIREGIKVVSEIELAYHFLNMPIIAVTGTNGKTTTTSLIGRMLADGGKRVWVGGNIGSPLIEACEEDDIEFVVCEVSSFQLEWIEDFKPFIGILLNITEDHLDRHPSFRDYAETKVKLFMNQKPSDYAILNGDDPVVTFLSGDLPSHIVRFSLQGGVMDGAFIEGDEIRLSLKGGREVYPIADIRLKGLHNLENVMAAIVASRLCGVERDTIIETLKGFEGLPHRVEFVREYRGVSYYNDSKGTNTGAVMRSIECMGSPVVLIMGGKDKGIDYSVLRPVIKKKVKRLILFGEAKTRIEKALNNSIDMVKVKNLHEAVKVARDLAEEGDAVLFSPACSSFDMFRDYVERGEVFKRLVTSLQ